MNSRLTTRLLERGYACFGSADEIDFFSLRRRGPLLMRHADMRAAATRYELLRAIATAVDSPREYLPHLNLDSVDEIVRDLYWLDFQNICLVLHGASIQMKRDRKLALKMFHILADAHRLWKQEGRGFFLAYVR